MYAVVSGILRKYFGYTWEKQTVDGTRTEFGLFKKLQIIRNILAIDLSATSAGIAFLSRDGTVHTLRGLMTYDADTDLYTLSTFDENGDPVATLGIADGIMSVTDSTDTVSISLDAENSKIVSGDLDIRVVSGEIVFRAGGTVLGKIATTGAYTDMVA